MARRPLIALPAGSCYQARETTGPRRPQGGPVALSRRDLLALSGLTLAGTALNATGARAQSPKRGGTLTLRGWDPPMFDHMLRTAYVDDPVVTDMLIRQRRIHDVAKRREVIHDLQRYLAKQQYYVQLPSGIYVAVWDGA